MKSSFMAGDIAEKINALSMLYANGVEVRIYLAITEEQIMNEFPEHNTPLMRQYLHMIAGEDYVIVKYKSGYKRYINITGDSAWCVVTEIANHIMKHL